MQELRFVAVSEDGSYAVLAVPGRSARFILPIDERLRAVALGQISRLAQYEIEVESPLRPKEIQARIRAGETAEEIADAAGIPVERVRWFEGPVLAERAYIAQQAQTATVRRQGDSAGPGPHLEDIVAERVSASGGDPEEGQWDSRKRGDGNWQVQLTYSAGGRLHIAEWMFDPRRRHVMPEDDTAARLSLPESELPPLPENLPGEATVTPIASRLGAAAGMGSGSSMSRYRPEPPPYPEHAPERVPGPDRTAGPDRATGPDRTAAGPERTAGWERTRVPAPAPAPARPGANRPGAPARPPAGDRPSADRPAAYAQPPVPPSEPRPASPTPAYYHDQSERTVPPPPSPPSDGRRAGAPWSDSARYGDRPPAYQPDAYQPGDYQFPDHGTPEPETDGYTPEPAPAADAAPSAQNAAPPTQDAVPPAEVQPEPAPAEVPEPAARVEPTPAAEPAPAAEPVTATEPAPASTAQASTAAASTAQAGKTAPAPAKTGPARKEPPAKKAPPVTKEPAPKKASAPVKNAPVKETAPAAQEDKPAAEEQPQRPRPAKKNPRNRRSSVPSWDEIMLGSSRQND